MVELFGDPHPENAFSPGTNSARQGVRSLVRRQGASGEHSDVSRALDGGWRGEGERGCCSSGLVGETDNKRFTYVSYIPGFGVDYIV